MSTIRRTLSNALPDPLHLLRARETPAQGARLLFFSGGTALRGVSQELVRYTHNSVHLITPFDSGGSSAALRQAFDMPAIGDCRNRLMALADRSSDGVSAVFELLAHRLPTAAEKTRLERQLGHLVDGSDPRMTRIPVPDQQVLRRHLNDFVDRMPPGFDLRGASIGNLVLAGGYLSGDRQLDPVISEFSRLVGARGVVRLVTARDLHLAAELADGETVVGQHRLTGKEVAPLSQKVARIYLTKNQRQTGEARVELGPQTARLIRSADLICYPVGSFYTSVLACLLVDGVGAAVAASDAPKIYVPNTGQDPEMIGLTLPHAVQQLLSTLRASGGGTQPTEKLLQYVLVDVARGPYDAEALAAVERLGVEVIDTGLITDASAPYLDARRLTELLISMA